MITSLEGDLWIDRAATMTTQIVKGLITTQSDFDDNFTCTIRRVHARLNTRLPLATPDCFWHITPRTVGAIEYHGPIPMLAYNGTVLGPSFTALGITLQERTTCTHSGNRL